MHYDETTMMHTIYYPDDGQQEELNLRDAFSESEIKFHPQLRSLADFHKKWVPITNENEGAGGAHVDRQQRQSADALREHGGSLLLPPGPKPAAAPARRSWMKGTGWVYESGGGVGRSAPAKTTPTAEFYGEAEAGEGLPLPPPLKRLRADEGSGALGRADSTSSLQCGTPIEALLMLEEDSGAGEATTNLNYRGPGVRGTHGQVAAPGKEKLRAELEAELLELQGTAHGAEGKERQRQKPKSFVAGPAPPPRVAHAAARAGERQKAPMRDDSAMRSRAMSPKEHHALSSQTTKVANKWLKVPSLSLPHLLSRLSVTRNLRQELHLTRILRHELDVTRILLLPLLRLERRRRSPWSSQSPPRSRPPPSACP